ncbi:MAG TPA: tRNA1(Val) (adenine(37)-N6)-methyltransferase [Dissulfurispiraceae bacterium]|nr:tRNA1(Val) (adenine(37)-N6)-methyltransferase [Dissulfurispiraceae bacterium]
MLTLDSILDIQLYQHKSGYRFSADAVLLASFVDMPRVKKIADFGAGSGVIGILLAKKYLSADVKLIELQESLVKLAEKNVILNHLDERVKVVHADIKGLKLGSLHSYDLVVSNPPFRKTRTGLVSPSGEKAVARHELNLSISALMKSALTMLKHHGRLCMIHLPERLAEVMESMRQYYLEPKRLRFVHSNAGSEAKMVFIEAVKEGRTGLKVERPLYLYDDNGDYTDEVRAIYGRPQGF